MKIRFSGAIKSGYNVVCCPADIHANAPHVYGLLSQLQLTVCRISPGSLICG